MTYFKEVMPEFLKEKPEYKGIFQYTTYRGIFFIVLKSDGCDAFFEKLIAWLKKNPKLAWLADEEDFFVQDGCCGDWIMDSLAYGLWGYDSEYYICSNCGKAIHMNCGYPDLYWRDDIRQILYCKDCTRLHIDKYINYSILNHNRLEINNPILKTIVREEGLKQYGFQKKGRNYELGLCDGWDDSPSEIIAELTSENPESDFLIVVPDHDNLFNVEYEIWERKNNAI